MIKLPTALGLLPETEQRNGKDPVKENVNSAFEVAVNVSSSARAQALKFFNSRLTVGELLGNWWFVDVCVHLFTYLSSG